jgi:hypothetical protein
MLRVRFNLVVGRVGPHIALEYPYIAAKWAAPLVAVFDEWAPRTSPPCSFVTDRGGLAFD